jgi:hypothetical protein
VACIAAPERVSPPWPCFDGLQQKSTPTLFEGAHLQVRRCEPFIFVIPKGFSPEESAVPLNCRLSWPLDSFRTPELAWRV